MGISIRRSRDLGSSALTLPAGVINPFAGVTAPDGWMLCYGQAISRTQYVDLFNALSTTYGTGDGSTTFNLPDMRGRSVSGKDDMGGSAANRITQISSYITATTLGATGGNQTITLATAQLPSHTHIQDAHGHIVSANSFAGDRQIAVGPIGADGDKYSFSDSGNDASTTTANIYARSTTATNQTTGSGAAHENMQPTIILNYIIKV